MVPSLEHGAGGGSGKARRTRSKREYRVPKTALRVLVVEDSVDDALLVALELERGGYETYWERVETPEAMREALDGKHWDLVIADHAMPRFSAPAALEILQEKGLDLPFIIVSREIGEDTAVAAMRAGAHDYIMKDNLGRLCPAVERELREAEERRERRRSAAALKQSEELYRAVVQQSSECIFLVEARSKRIIEANEAFRKLLGYTPEELRGMTLYDFVAHDRTSVDEKIHLILKEGQHNIGERRYRRKDGTLVDVEVRANALLLDDREVMCCVSHDVTERKKAEEALREAEEKYRSIFENSIEGIFQATVDGRLLLTANPALAHMFGYESAEAMLTEVRNVHSQLYVDTGKEEEFERCLREREDVTGFEFRARRRDGVEIWVSLNARVVCDEGEPAFLEGTVEDITERKLAEEALATRARQQSVVAELGRRALAATDLSALMEEMVALVARTLKVEYCEILELLPEGDALLLRSGVGWREGLAGNATVGAGSDSQDGYTLRSDNPVVVEDLRTETRFRGPALLRDHGVVSGMSVIVRGREGPFGVLGVHTKEKRTFTDDDVNFLRAVANVISAAVERQRAEERLNEIKELERRRIAADLHDVVLQDLMFGLLETQLMQVAARGSDDKGPNLDSLETTSEALQRSVEGLREAIFELRLEENLERSFVSAVEALVDITHRMSRKRYEVHLVAEDMFAEMLPTDAGRSLLRIVQEALNNARCHSDARNIRVTLKMKGDDVCVEVADDGRGFDTGSTRGGVGTSTMLQRALVLGGDLDIESEPGVGTVVRFRGPAGRLLRDQSDFKKG